MKKKKFVWITKLQAFVTPIYVYYKVIVGKFDLSFSGARYCGKDPIKSLELARDTVTGFGNKHRTLPYN